MERSRLINNILRPRKDCGSSGAALCKTGGKVTENKENYNALSLSGGKDSSCALLLMIEKDMPIDCVLYAETGMDFPEMTEHIAKLDDLLYRERGIHITTLRHPKGFEWLMFDVPQQQKRAIERRIAMGQPLTGYGWPGMRVRWCTGQLKTHLIEKEVNRLKQEKNALHYIGYVLSFSAKHKG